MSTHASRNTSTGLTFERKVVVNRTGINLTKNKLYTYLKEKGIDWQKVISRKLLPDEAYLSGDTLDIYEKKYQQTQGSADEKLQTCAFKILQYKKIADAIGVTNTRYTYILSDWFKQDIYKDVLDYIRTVPGCDYIFEEDIDNTK